MADDPKPIVAKRTAGDTLSSVSRIDKDKFVVEFTIDDLIKDLLIDPISPVAACNGCNACSKGDITSISEG